MYVGSATDHKRWSDKFGNQDKAMKYSENFYFFASL